MGWTDGRNVRIDLRRHGGDINRIRALAQELVSLKPDIILAQSTLATVALQRETRTIPIVFVNVFPDTYEMAVNLRSAGALGLVVPQSILPRADEVFQ